MILVQFQAQEEVTSLLPFLSVQTMTAPPSALSNVEWRPLEGLFLSSRKVTFFKIFM